MVKNSTYFYLGGLISLSLFIFFLSLFFYMMFLSSSVKTYALEKNNYISISLTTPTIEIKKDNKKIERKVVTENSSVTSVKKEQLQDVNVEDLFSDVWTNKITTKKKEPKRVEQNIVNSKVLKELEKKIKTLEPQEREKISKDNSSEQKSQEDKKEIKSISAGEYNEYLAKINALVYQHFNPPKNSEGHSVKAVIELSAIGKVKDFRILTYSGNDSLNGECDRIRARLLRVIFPLNPKNIPSRTIVILTSKE